MLLVGVAAAAIATPAAAAEQIYNIPPQSLKSALQAFGLQSGEAVTFRGEVIGNVRSSGAVGRFETEAALAALLKGSSLSFVRAEGGFIIVAANRSSPRGQFIRSAAPLPAGLSSAAPPAQAASSPAGPGNVTQDVEEIVVTGSRVASVENSPTPLTVVSTEQLQTTTPKDIPDALNKLPVFQGSTGQRTQSGGGSNSSGNFLNLRNFGTERTLILLDGHRVVASGQNGAVDTNALPQMLVERVDIVTSGASAVYGSDAITGVVNFVLDTNFEGLRVQGNTGIAEIGEAWNYRLGAAVGKSLFDDRGHFIGSISVRQQDAVKYLDLPYGPDYWGQTGSASQPNNPLIMTPNSRNFWSAAGYVSGCGAGCSAAGMQFTSPGILGPFNPGLPTGTSVTRMGGDGGRGINGTALGSLNVYESFGRFDYDLTDSINAFVQSSYVVSSNWSAYYDPNLVPPRFNTYFKNNPFLTPSAQAALATGAGATFTLERLVNETEPMSNRAKNRLWNTTAGFSGTLGSYNWEAYYTHGVNKLHVDNFHNLNNARTMAAADAVVSGGQIVCYVSTVPAFAALYPGCVPLNPFGRGTITEDQLDFIAPDTAFDQTNKMDNVGGSITGDLFELPAGPVRAALTGEARRQTLQIVSPEGPFTKPVDCTGLRLCPTGHMNTWGFAVLDSIPKVSQSVWEVGAEANVPLLRDLPLVRSIDLNTAVRYADYKTSGGIWAWKVGADYRVNESLRFRGTVSRDMRAPTLTDLFGPFQATTGSFRDQHTNTTRGSTIQTNPSNPDLAPETSRTYTAGVVLTPSFVPGLTLAVDWYRIAIKNAISTISGSSDAVQAVCQASAPAYDSPFCRFYPRPNPWSDRSPANHPAQVRSERLNAAVQLIHGFDIEAAYRFDLESISSLPGQVSIRTLIGLQPHNKSQVISFVPAIYSAAPKGRVTTFLTYTHDDWTVAVQNRWLSSWYKGSTSIPQYYGDAPRVKSFHTTDVTVSHTLEIRGVPTDLYVNIENVTDEHGPLWGGNAQSPGFSYPVPGGYPILGRTYAVGFRSRF